MAFRSKLEEKVADLLVDLGVKYEYETTKVRYIIQEVYTPDLRYLMVSCWNVRVTGNLLTVVRSGL